MQVVRLQWLGVGWLLASCAVALGWGASAGSSPNPLPPPTPPPPVPPSGKPTPEAASTLVVPIKADVDLVPKVEPDPQRGLAIRGLLRWRLPEKP